MSREKHEHLQELISYLNRASYENKAKIWKDIAKRLERPRKNWAEVNVSKIEKYVKNGEMAVVPGKLLGSGTIKKKVTVGAYSCSKSAFEKIKSAGGEVLDLRKFVEKNPSGKNVKIIG